MIRRISSTVLVALFALAPLIASPSRIGSQATTSAMEDNAPHLECAAMPPEESEALVQAWVTAENANDADALGLLLAEDSRNHWSIGAETQTKAQFLTLLEELFEAFDNYTFTGNQILVGDNMAVLLWTAAGTQTAEFLEFPPSDVLVTWTGVLVFEFDCGEIVSVWASADNLSRLMQQGTISITPVEPEATPAQRIQK